MLKKVFCLIIFFSIVLQLYLSKDLVYAAKQTNVPASTNVDDSLKPINNKGKQVVYGSVLDPQLNQVLLFLPKKLLATIRRAGLEQISINIVSALDSTKTFSIPTNAFSLQRKKIEGKSKKYLIANLSNLKTPSGITISPSTLTTDYYRLNLEGKSLSVSTDYFNYQTPTIIVGKIDSQAPGLVAVEDLNGKTISNATVTTTPDGTFLTEVTADKIPVVLKEAELKALSLNLDSESVNITDEDINKNSIMGGKVSAGVVHAITDKELLAIIPLNNDAKNNNIKSDKPIVLDANSTLTANIGKNFKELAIGIAEDQLQELQSEEPVSKESEPPPANVNCDINQFASRCTDISSEILSSIGADFKKFIVANNCDVPGFAIALVKELLLASSAEIDGNIGKGYCEYVTNIQTNETRPCKVYAEILAKFKSGVIDQLPCPPPFCDKFQNIKPPKCISPIQFCATQEEGISFNIAGGENTCRGANCKSVCINRPVKDLFCARIGVDITDKECNEGIGSTENIPWTVAASSKQNLFCVPNSLQSFENANFTLQEIADGCELSSCHKKCEQIFTSKTNFTSTSTNIRSLLETNLKKQESTIMLGATDTNTTITVGETSSSSSGSSGNIGNTVTLGGEDDIPIAVSTSGAPRCDICDCHFTCDAEVGRIVDCTNPLSKYFSIKCCNSKASLPKQPLSPIPLDIKSCLCERFNNFTDNGIVKEEAQIDCKTRCPQGYEKDPNADECLPICPSGFVRNPDGNCKKKCPKGFVEDESGNCVCPEDLILGPAGTCILPPPAPCFAQEISTSVKPCICIFPAKLNAASVCECPTGLIYSDVGCIPQRICDPLELPSLDTCKCAQGAFPVTSLVTPNTFSTLTITTCQCPPNQTYTINGCKFSPPRICAANEPPAITNCRCATGSVPTSVVNNTSSSVNVEVLCQCPPGQIYTTLGCKTQTPRTCPPGEVSFISNCTCAFGAKINSLGVCQCPNNNQTYTETGCITFSTISNNCLPGEVSTPLNPCTCPAGAKPNPFGTCDCPPGLTYTENGCIASSIRTCNANESPTINNCKCALGATSKLSSATPGIPTFGILTDTCQCPLGQLYTTLGCKPIPSHICSLGEVSTQTNPCTCASGATVKSTGSCECPSGQTYTTTGCKSICGIALASTSANPCTCASPATPTGPGGLCQCPAGQAYTGNGCSAITKVCEPGQSSALFDPCNCPSPATYALGETGICKCPEGQVYTTNGCTTSTIKCAFGQKPTATVPCSCASPATPIGTGGECICPDGQTYSASGCSPTTRICGVGEFALLANPCICAGEATFNLNRVCTCPTGQTYTKNGCTTNQSQLVLTSAVVSSNNIIITFSSNLNETFFMKDSLNNNLGSFFASSPLSVPLSSFPNIMIGVQMKLCSSSNQNLCTGLVTVIDSTNPATSSSSGLSSSSSGGLAGSSTSSTSSTSSSGSTTSNTITLTSASVSGNNVTFNFTKNFANCVTVKDSSNINRGSFCSDNTFTTTRSVFPNVLIDSQVKLCSSVDDNVCSQLITVTGTKAVLLNGVVISGTNVTVSYDTNFSACTQLKDTNSNPLHSSNLFCNVGNVSVTFPISSLNTGFQSGTQVKLCHVNDINTCSPIVTVTGS